MIKDKNTINREGLKIKLVELFEIKYKEAMNIVNSNKEDGYKEKFERLREKYDVAKIDRIEID